jgi:tetratricopeptide (TPR) repeat protein
MPRFAFLFLVFCANSSYAGLETSPGVVGDFSFYAPVNPPSSSYRIEARIDIQLGNLEGKETISLKNNARNPIGIIAFNWDVGPASSLEVACAGKKLYPPADFSLASVKRPVFVHLAQPLYHDMQIELEVKFRVNGFNDDNNTGISTDRWYPRLWWNGLGSHDSYSVKLDAPEGCVLAASGRRNPKTGRYEAVAAATFGIYIAKGMKTDSREVDGVLITSIFTEKGARAAAICLETAADAVHFYKNWLGFYPFPFLTIIPGGAGRWGGYPVATGIVAIHGLETYVEGESPQHWQFITSHEIGHQYWGEWVLDPDSPAWLWIALGIFADTEFMTARGFDPARGARWMGNYINAIPMYYDTTLDIPPARAEQFRFDRNNTVIHSKGPAVIFALDSMLGRDQFLRIYKRCLREYGGKRLSWTEFQKVCEVESGQNLQWFFDSWVRSNQYLCYSVESQGCRADTVGYRCNVSVRRLGTLAMPIPVKAIFEDGTEQTAFADRNRVVTPLTFAGKTKLKEVILNPDGRLAMVKRPVAKISAVAAARLSDGWVSASAPELYVVLKREPIDSPEIWYRLGTDLYNRERLAEALDCFTRIDSLETGRLTAFAAHAWRGLIEDLRGNRAAALEQYKGALAMDSGETMSHSRPRLKIDRAWVEDRLKKPFQREMELSLATQPTAAELIAAVGRMDYSNEGRNPLIIFEKTQGHAINAADFWFKLGLMLFDSGFYRESLKSFERDSSLEERGVRAFAAWAWQGHLQDLLGNRPQALVCYREALKRDTGNAMQHSQYQMVIDREWIEARMKIPFTRDW